MPALIAFWIAIVGPAIGVANPDPTPSVDGDGNCGVYSLYLLLRIHQRPVEIEDVWKRFPPPTNPQGYSIHELAGASSGLGLPVECVRIDPRVDPFPRAMVVYLRRQGSGHFVVVRPIGQKARWVQLIDPTVVARILTREQLLDAPGWTGYAIIPLETRFARSRWKDIVFLALWIMARHGIRTVGSDRRLTRP